MKKILGNAILKNRVKEPQQPKLGNLLLKSEATSSTPSTSSNFTTSLASTENVENVSSPKKRGRKKKISNDLSASKVEKVIKKKSRTSWQFPDYTLTPYTKKNTLRGQRSRTSELNETPKKSIKSPEKKPKKDDQSNEEVGIQINF